MTRRLLTFLFAVYYLCLSVGVNISMHYCSGDLVSWTLDTQVPSCGTCDAPGESVSDEEDSCCQEKHHFLKKSGDDLATQQLHIGLDHDFPVLHTPLVYFEAAAGSYGTRVPERLPELRGPPGSDPPSYILFGNFRV